MQLNQPLLHKLHIRFDKMSNVISKAFNYIENDAEKSLFNPNLRKGRVERLLVSKDINIMAALNIFIAMIASFFSGAMMPVKSAVEYHDYAYVSRPFCGEGRDRPMATAWGSRVGEPA